MIPPLRYFICWNCRRFIVVQKNEVPDILAGLKLLHCSNCGRYGESDPMSGEGGTTYVGDPGPPEEIERIGP